MFYLVAGEAFVEVGEVAVEVEGVFRGHAYVDEEGGEGESAYVGEVVTGGEGVVEGLYARWEGFGVDGLGDFFLFDGAFYGGERVFEFFYCCFDFGWEGGGFGVEFCFDVFADFFLEEAGGFVVGEVDFAVV